MYVQILFLQTKEISNYSVGMANGSFQVFPMIRKERNNSFQSFLLMVLNLFPLPKFKRSNHSSGMEGMVGPFEVILTVLAVYSYCKALTQKYWVRRDLSHELEGDHHTLLRQREFSNCLGQWGIQFRFCTHPHPLLSFILCCWRCSKSLSLPQLDSYLWNCGHSLEKIFFFSSSSSSANDSLKPLVWPITPCFPVALLLCTDVLPFNF
jgi:hypothetical protein